MSARSNVQDRVFSCDDFVIPRSRTSASFTRETGGGLTDLDCCATSHVETITASASSTSATITDKYRSQLQPVPIGLEQSEQEVRMISEFSRLVYWSSKSNTRSPTEDYWARIALATQLVLDACMVSMKSGGKETPVGSLE